MQCLVTWSSHRYFYPRPPRGGRLGCRWALSRANKFLSTPSARRATHTGHHAGCAIDISIHALREEGDRGVVPLGYVGTYFYPRPPRGGRLKQPAFTPLEDDFYPRPPRGGRLVTALSEALHTKISIHALREEGDRLHGRDRQEVHQFLSTPSARRATGSCARASRSRRFLSTPSARRATIVEV